MSTDDLVKMMTESHTNFVNAVLMKDGKLALLCYTNYIRAFCQVLENLDQQEG